MLEDVARVMLSPKAELFFDRLESFASPEDLKQVLDLTLRLTEVIETEKPSKAVALLSTLVFMLLWAAELIPVELQLASFGTVFSNPQQPMEQKARLHLVREDGGANG